MNYNRYNQSCQTFWIILVIAVILIWVHYCMCGDGCGDNCGCNNGCNDRPCF